MSYSDVAVIAIVWVAAGSTMRRSIRTRRSMLPSGVLLWAVACTLQAKVVYDWIDPLLGGGNTTNLLYRTLTICALGCLEVMVIRATRGRNKRAEVAVAVVVTIGIALQAALFWSSSWPITDTYLSAYGGELGRELFWNVMPCYVGLFSLHVLITAGMEWRAHSVRATRWGLALIGLSAFVDILWLIESLSTSTIRLVSDSSVLLDEGPDIVATALLGTMVACTGLGVALASAEIFVDRLWMRFLLIRVIPIWYRVISAAPELNATGGRSSVSSLFTLEVEHILYRKWKEMLDCERAGVFIPSFSEQALLDSVALALGGSIVPSKRQSPAGISGLLSSSSVA